MPERSPLASRNLILIIILSSNKFVGADASVRLNINNTKNHVKRCRDRRPRRPENYKYLIIIKGWNLMKNKTKIQAIIIIILLIILIILIKLTVNEINNKNNNHMPERKWNAKYGAKF